MNRIVVETPLGGCELLVGCGLTDERSFAHHKK